MANSERFDAALLHVYGYNEDQRPDRENKHSVPVRPDIRGRLVISAARELKTLRKTADDNSWQNLLSISWELHKPRVKALAKKIFRRKKKKIVFLSAEDVLFSHPTPRNIARYKRVIDNVHDTKEERNWQVYEEKLLKIIRIPFASNVLDLVARFYRPNAQK